MNILQFKVHQLGPETNANLGLLKAFYCGFEIEPQSNEEQVLGVKLTILLF